MNKEDHLHIEQSASTVEDTLWYTLGLTQAPFAHTTHHAMMLPITAWARTLRRMQDAITNKPSFLLLLAAPGMGKTCFAEQLTANIQATGSRVLRVAGHAHFQPQHLVHALTVPGQHLALQPGESSQRQLDDWLKSWLALTEEGNPQVFIIDDADKMPLATLAAVMYLCLQANNQAAKLSVVLVGKPALREKIDLMLARDTHTLPLACFMLHALTQQECFSYIRYRLKKAGMPADCVLPHSWLKRIYQLSEGVPKRINVLATESLQQGLRFAPKKASSTAVAPRGLEERLAGSMWQEWLRPATYTALLLTCFAVWSYQGVIDRDILAHHWPGQRWVSSMLGQKVASQSYTVALMDEAGEAPVVAYRVSNHLEQDTQIYTNVSSVADKLSPEYILAYGRYATWQAAQQALASLPKFNAVHPVIKQLDNMQLIQ